MVIKIKPLSFFSSFGAQWFPERYFIREVRGSIPLRGLKGSIHTLDFNRCSVVDDRFICILDVLDLSDPRNHTGSTGQVGEPFAARYE